MLPIPRFHGNPMIVKMILESVFTSVIGGDASGKSTAERRRASRGMLRSAIPDRFLALRIYLPPVCQGIAATSSAHRRRIRAAVCTLAKTRRPGLYHVPTDGLPWRRLEFLAS
jgi:hypothetical protein